MITKLTLCCLLLIALAAAGRAAPDAKTLQAGLSRLTLLPTLNHGWGVRLETRAAGFGQMQPLALEVVGTDGAAHWLTDSYQTVTALAGSLVGTGTLVTEHGSVFQFTDTWQPAPSESAWTITRRVEVKTVGVGDAGFSSRLSLLPQKPTAFRDCDFFMPGIWYKNNAHVPRHALASSPVGDAPPDPAILIREDRLPLPLIGPLPGASADPPLLGKG